MNPLPHGIADPLHIDEPFPTWALVAAALGVWLLYRLFRYVRDRPAVPLPVLESSPAPAQDGRIGSVIEAIRRRAFERNALRAGCHELAAALREHFGRNLAPGVSLEHLTASEIERRLGDTAVSRYFRLLSGLQFLRRPPTASDFDGACDLALEVVVHATATPSAPSAVRAARADRGTP